MSHKAYVFDFLEFERELAPLLREALQTDEPGPLMEFIDAERARLTLPWDADPLAKEWRSGLVSQDVQEIGDIALTKYYDVRSDYGVDKHWHALDQRLPPHSRKWLLGSPLGSEPRIFDPGRSGSYFQSPEQVRDAQRLLAAYNDPHIRVFQRGLDEAVRVGRGLYVTF